MTTGKKGDEGKFQHLVLADDPPCDHVLGGAKPFSDLLDPVRRNVSVSGHDSPVAIG